MLSKQKQNDTYRVASEILSNTTFRKVIKESDYTHFTDKINRHSDLFLSFKSKNNGEFIKDIYKLLSKNYRNEYVYKNTILKKIIKDKTLKENTSIVINEFKVGKSIADLVFINGENRVFEIKTELDSPERLKTQIFDYQKVFSEIYIVTHWTLQDKYLSILQKNKDFSNVGLIVLDEKFKLETIKTSNISNAFLDTNTLFKLLRKNEYCSLLESVFGKLPDVPNTLFFKECLKLANSIAPEKLQKLVFQELKKRNLKELEYLNKKKLNEIKHICLCLDFSKSEYQALDDFLNTPFLK
ncbi:sce7726 family protein [Arcicella lustrica]|uniref:Sce7726 family protein n=1 Tax=Arcicella lustrica TaxID=2984196 RepID=A0ABU5SLW2_9BACT|nr:sce7726 family protein [Arcicella sp. DC25W]MEA5428250.1 sce7726 family protein [Arcicella sp. DC25W]